MDVNRVPTPLMERLGGEATAGLLELLTEVKQEWTADVMDRIGDRFERRLTDETSKLRVEMAQGFAGLRQELTEGLAAVRQEMTEGLAAVRQEMTEGLAAVRREMAEGLAAVRQDMAAGFAGLRQELADQRFELLKWAFLFWVGQFFAVAGLIAVVIRFLRPAG